MYKMYKRVFNSLSMNVLTLLLVLYIYNVGTSTRYLYINELYIGVDIGKVYIYLCKIDILISMFWRKIML